MTYIQHLAKDLLSRFGADLSRVAVVFPNKRASLFLNEELARQANRALWSPSYVTISDLFRRHGDLEVADQILLVCRLYDVYVRCTGFETETLDRFYSWGVLLLADFDDIDKNMADAEKVFQVVKDLHELDDINYLSEEQRESLKHFFRNFTDGHQTMMQEKFMRLWSKLYEIYTTFRDELRNDGLAYEGMLYRDVVEQAVIDFEYDTYCFVGFNMLQVVEQQLFTRLKNMDAAKGSSQPRALFYWDYDTYYLNQHHEAGHFISDYLSRFPDALKGSGREEPAISDNFCKKNNITYISAPTENLQARYVHDWLLENDRYKAGAKTAIVMCDERLLQTIIRSLPDEVDKVNITTGYPLSQSPIATLLQLLIELQTSGFIQGKDIYRIRSVSNILCHPYATFISPLAAAKYQDLIDKKRFYPTRSELTDDEGLALLFKDINTVSVVGYDNLPYNVQMIVWLQNIIKRIDQFKETETDAQESDTSESQVPELDALARESLFRAYQVLQRLYTLSVDGTLNVDVNTLRRLLMQIIGMTTVPYHGEPIEGIQIMGVLETRCLDFDHLLVLSCNEGNMPKGVNDSSFIPHSVRKAYGLTTVENKVGIYSYYFHRLLQRVGDATLAYNSSTEGMNTGEMSRFMLQLMVESGIPVRRISLQTGQETYSVMPKEIVKDEVVQAQLVKLLGPNRTVSPSSLGKYLRCQLAYYYQYVAGLKEQIDDEPEEVDNIAFGLIFHKAAELAYSKLSDTNNVIHADVLESAIKDKSLIERIVDDAFNEELFNNGSHPDYTGLQLINHDVIVHLLRNTMNYDKRNTPFMVYGNEVKRYTSIPVNLPDGEQQVRIGGSIDRLDILGNDNVGRRFRIVDYKTGSKEPDNIESVEAIFDPANISKHSDYYLQTLLYGTIIRHDKEVNPEGYPVEPSLLYVQRCNRKDYNPVLNMAKQPIADVGDFDTEFRERLSALISEIHNPDIPFQPTSNVKHCESCPFRSICGL